MDIGGSQGGGTNIVGFVEVAMEAVVIEGYIYVDDVAVLEGPLVGDAVTDDFVDGGTNGFGEVDVVEGRGVRLHTFCSVGVEGYGRGGGAYVSF